MLKAGLSMRAESPPEAWTDDVRAGRLAVERAEATCEERKRGEVRLLRTGCDAVGVFWKKRPT
eukprot:895297-Rhodomonas_salina.1